MLKYVFVYDVLKDDNYPLDEGTGQILVLANYHVDLYSAEWVLHEVETAPFGPHVVSLIEHINCKLDLSDQWKN